jgi:hypothetical protein
LRDIKPDEWNNIPLPVSHSIKVVVEQLINCIVSSMTYEAAIKKNTQELKYVKNDLIKEIRDKQEQTIKEAKMNTEMIKNGLINDLNFTKNDILGSIEQS